MRRIRLSDPCAEAIVLVLQQGYSSEITARSHLSNFFHQSQVQLKKNGNRLWIVTRQKFERPRIGKDKSKTLEAKKKVLRRTSSRVGEIISAPNPSATLHRRR